MIHDILLCNYIGQYLGSFISFPVTALLCVYGFDGGWPSAFYIFGNLPLTACAWALHAL